MTSIGYMAFYYCSGLTSVTIPNSVTSIGEKAFYGCDILSEVISKIEDPFNIGTNMFSDNTFYNATLYIPAGTIGKYKATEGWKNFVFIEESYTDVNVKLNKNKLVVEKTKTAKLTATVYPSTLTDKSVKWTSSDKSIATVTSSGKVKGVAPGTATITCTSVATGLKGTCTVTVLSVSEARGVGGDDDGTTAIENLDESPAAVEPFDVYDLSGRKVRHQATSLDGLPNGVYIVNGKKILKKD